MAILEEEPDAGLFHDILRGDNAFTMGAPTLFELKMVALSRKPDDGLRLVDELLDSYGIEIREWGEAEGRIAIDAFARFGRGRHPAKLNYGDCMAYALARSLDAPLLFKGGDFAATDVRRAVG